MCRKKLVCGHACNGVVDESQCLPCLECDSDLGNEFCAICYTEDLRSSPSVLLDCGHILHCLCVLEQLKAGPSGLRLTFSHLDCPLCKQRISCKRLGLIESQLAEGVQLEKTVASMAYQRLVYEGLLGKAKRILKSESESELIAYAMKIYSYYPCFECEQPYFAGLAVCGDAPDAQAGLCGMCEEKKRPRSRCDKHGSEYMQWKCRFCCSIAAFKCWGSHSFCQSCHSIQVAGEHLSKKKPSAFPICSGKEHCPLKVNHPHVEEFSLGCALCKNERSF